MFPAALRAPLRLALALALFTPLAVLHAVPARAQTSVRQPAVYPACTATAIGAACDPTASSCAPAPSTTASLVVDGTGASGAPRAVVLGGTVRYASVTVRNCGRIYVRPYNGSASTSGTLRLIAPRITVDATSAVVADGAGYLPNLCRDGYGPALTTNPSTPAGDPTGGRGGCRLRDSAGGGGHFGVGGRGTIDCGGGGCVFPGDWEQACPGALPTASTPTVQGASSCPSTTSCRTGTGTLSNAGPSYFHNIYTLEMGAAGGDAGCRDGDGFESGHFTATLGRGVGGAGGGSIALVSLASDSTGALDIAGYVVARGGRGCAWDNDSGGGGAGGTILLVGDTVTVRSTAVVSAQGGPGGSGASTGGGSGAWWNACGASNSTICDDCGGGGGGGIVNVKSRSANLDTRAFFLASGGPGGGNFDGCTVCQGEAGGGAGEIQLDGAYVGEVCDGFDNDFDGSIDEDLGNVSCGLGTCASSTAACTSGSPPACTPVVGSDPTCTAPRDAARPRIAVVLDSSGSMLWNLAGTPTFGDGSADHPGIDLNADGRANDSRIYLAKNALSEVISAYPEIDFAFARYHQDQSINRSCQSAKWFECNGNCCSYDNPNNGLTTSPIACQLSLPRSTTGSVALTVRDDSPASNRCINYAGTCGTPRRGADVLVGFGSDVRQYVRWLDGRETGFDPSATPGNYCNGLAGDCELRAAGPTPLAGALQTVYDYVRPIQLTDPAAACRGYSVILVSDGGEECNGNPAAAAAELLAAGVRTYVIGVSVKAAESATLNAIAAAGGTGTFVPVNAPDQLVPALTRIVSGSIRVELCNGIDDNCNGLIDEGYNVGAACDNGMRGACAGTGRLACVPGNPQQTYCALDRPGATASAERCNNLDDDCDGLVDEGDPQGGGPCGTSTGTCEPGIAHCAGGTLACVGATGPRTEVCNGLDDDCDGMVDEGLPAGGPCGNATGECRPGMFVCRGTQGYVCEGGTPPTAEVCDGLDNDCDGTADDEVPGTGVACNSDDGGATLCRPGVVRCIGGALHCRGGTPFHRAECTCQPDACAITGTDGGSDGVCPTGSACRACACRVACRGGEFPCPGDLVCRDGYCVPPVCGGQLCAATEACVNDRCVDRCATVTCPSGQTCLPGGRCVSDDCYGRGCPSGQVCREAVCRPDPCAGVSCQADEFCRAGTCVRTCEGVACPSGQRCRAGACVADPCAGLSCPSGQVCNANAVLDGGTGARCVPDLCVNRGCGTGLVCRDGACVDDPCAGIACPGDPAAVFCRAGECVSRGTVTPPPPRERGIATGGGGFAGCAVGPRPGAEEHSARGAALALACGALGLLARRRRRASAKGAL